MIDLSHDADQPCPRKASAARRLNGEIYNFESLRKELEAHGHVFRTRSDTEVIVRAYAQWGTAGVARLSGMFAFAIGIGAPAVFLARDRGRQETAVLRARWRDGRVRVGAAGRARAPDVPRHVDAHAIDSYLSWGYVPRPRDGVRDVLMLPLRTG